MYMEELDTKNSAENYAFDYHHGNTVGEKPAEAEWCKYALVNEATNGSVSDLSHIQCQSIIWTNTALMIIGPAKQTHRFSLTIILKMSL